MPEHAQLDSPDVATPPRRSGSPGRRRGRGRSARGRGARGGGGQGGRGTVIVGLELPPPGPSGCPPSGAATDSGSRDQRGEPAGLRVPQPDPDTVPGRQAADHEQAHAAGHRDVHDGRVVEAPVRVRHLLLGDADAVVGDVEQHAAAGQRLAGDVHLGVLGRERGRVLHDLRHEVHAVVDDLPMTWMPGCTLSTTRSYCSISEIAARSTSTGQRDRLSISATLTEAVATVLARTGLQPLSPTALRGWDSNPQPLD